MSDTRREAQEEETARALLQDAGPRPALPRDDLISIREAAREQWRRQYGGRPAAARPARFRMVLAAAAVLAVVGLVWWGRQRDSAPSAAPSVASIERLTGVARWEAVKESPVQLLPEAVGRALSAGSGLETGAGSEGEGRLALRMTGRASVRLDSGTRLRLASASVIELERGAVYVDTGAEPDRGEEVAVRTPAGLFQGIGTQFEVRAEPEEAVTRLRVREGSVRLERGDGSVLTGTGQELVVRGDGSLRRGQTALYGPEWDWVLKTAPMLDIEGVKVRRFLDWMARESGRRIEFADQETAAIVDSAVLHGSIAHLTPQAAIGVVLSSSGLDHRISDGTLIVFAARKSGNAPLPLSRDRIRSRQGYSNDGFSSARRAIGLTPKWGEVEEPILNKDLAIPTGVYLARRAPFPAIPTKGSSRVSRDVACGFRENVYDLSKGRRRHHETHSSVRICDRFAYSSVLLPSTGKSVCVGLLEMQSTLYTSWSLAGRLYLLRRWTALQVARRALPRPGDTGNLFRA